VGQLFDPRPDMWYLDGDWKSNQNNNAEKFERLMKSLNSANVFNGDLNKGVKLILQDTVTRAELNAIGISLDNDKLLVRLVLKPAAVISQPRRDTLFDRILSLLNKIKRYQ
jgi:hypothetical protein